MYGLSPRSLMTMLCLFLLSGCLEQTPPRAFDQQVYIWQRQWQPAHANALAQSRETFSALRVLALQAHPQAGWGRAYPDLDLLREDGRPVIAVVRLDGQLPQLDTEAILQRTLELARYWRAKGLPLQGVEIDHDCATARLPAYVELLRDLRRQLPEELQLSITALPAWLDSPVLDEVLAQVDSSVLQVHAVDDPTQGLFDPQRAEPWARAYAARSQTPFYLALPAYGVALVDNVYGLPQVESEAPLRLRGERRELRADPRQVAGLLDNLRSRTPDNLRGILWFRLPLPSDQRAWPLQTLLAVVHGERLHTAPSVRLRPANGVNEILVLNHGNLPLNLPLQVNLPAANCEAVDAVGGYRWQRTLDGFRFTPKQPGILPPGEERAVGWVRCQTLHQGRLNAVF